ncbi:UNVERIFIED_CONTAM: hypothetical protein QE387_001277 [Pseudacidovorax intermedius]|uniref:DUF5666 domain-containing protein n=2 Tax=Chryseobacterium group TaxID=2782232 RepID=A0ABU0TDU1_9FLAO|nr:hypothetical protein [Chryseobacterium camelliae]MDQ1099185.1 hypothetical protein [Chryseobacterium sp. SORGH_AS_1048]MDR6130905.1 hypothetical protein [Chryseobacterium sp. SORGH_AS_1175]MDT3406960.1 hypothetical protein [Pseudacidovorax intermedius]
MYNVNFNKMNNNVLNQGKKLAAAVFLMAAVVVNAQAQAPVPPKDPRPGIERPGPGPDALKEITTLSGTVSKMVTNDDFVYDGFYLNSNGGSVLVKFPPHLGSQITALAKQGSQISIKGIADVAPNGEKSFRMNSISANGKTIEDTPPAVPETPPQEVAVTESGTITDLQKNREGDAVVGIFVDQTLLKMPPHIYQQLGQSLVKGAKISFTGFKKPDNSGEVAERKLNIVHARTISVNGKEYSL